MFDYFVSHGHLYLHGLFITLGLMAASLIAGLLFALILCCVTTIFPVKTLRIVKLYVDIIRGTPLLLQFFLIYYGPGQFDWIQHTFLWYFLRGALFCSFFALANNTMCYSYVLFKGCLDTISLESKQAAQSLGLNSWQSLYYVQLPYALKKGLPAYSNEIIMMLKSTSLASTIAVMDLTGVTNQIIGQTYQTIQWYLVLAAIYLVITAIIEFICRKWVKTYYISA